MPTPSATAIYARISFDAEGLGKGVDRQVDDCEKFATRLGWAVSEHYIDNDISAYSGKLRPAYERMLTDIADGTIDSVLVYALDRLTRQPKEFERFNDIVNLAGLTDVRFVTGDMEFGTDDGLFVGRIQAAVAAKESATKSRRIMRKNDERAAEGTPHGGGKTRPFGFEDDRTTHNRAEVKIIRQLAARYLAGESLRSLAIWLDKKGVPTVSGGRWRTHTIYRILTAPRTVGLREHRGEIVGPGKWKPVLRPAVRNRILALHESREASGRRVPHSYLLSRLLRCCYCGHALNSAARLHNRRYSCQSGPDHGGCGRISVVAQPVEDLLAEAVLLRLDTPQLAEALIGRYRAKENTADLITEIESDRNQISELARLYGDKRITSSEWIVARDQIDSRVRKSQQRLAQFSSHGDLAAVIGRGEELRSKWSGLDLGRQVAIVRTLVDYVTILPGAKGSHALDPNRVEIVWRL